MSEAQNDENIEVRAIVSKASDMGLSNKLPEDPFSNLYGNNVIEPPFPLELLTRLAEYSEALGPCIEAMEVNCEGFGYRLEPTVKLPEEPEEGELTQEEKNLRKAMLQEKDDINNFFKFINYEESFTKLRKKTRKDYETVGFAFWEILKDGKGEPAGAVHLQAHTMRLCGLSEEPVEFKQKVKTGPDTIKEVTRKKRFRLFCQKKAGKTVYWKEYNDPRTIDAKTGKEVEDLTDREKENMTEAHEVIYFSRYNPRSPYGLPRWYNAMLSVLGSREAGEVNLQYFDNNTIPPMVAMVSGGRLTGDSVKRVEDYFKENKGKKSFSSVIVLQAKPADSQVNNPMNKGEVKIQMKPLTEAINKDALFQDYDQNNRGKVRATFRIPPIYMGESDDYNKATSETARKIAEEQVFGPEREEFDSYINRLLMPRKDYKYWEFVTNSPNTANNKDLSEMLADLSKDSSMDMNTARKIMSEIFSVDIDTIEEDWADYPMSIAKLMLTKEIKQLSQGQNIEKSAEDIAGSIVEKIFEIKKEVDQQVIEAGACKGQAGD